MMRTRSFRCHLVRDPGVCIRIERGCRGRPHFGSSLGWCALVRPSVSIRPLMSAPFADRHRAFNTADTRRRQPDDPVIQLAALPARASTIMVLSTREANADITRAQGYDILRAYFITERDWKNGPIR